MAKRGVHLNVYKVNPTTWRADLKVNLDEQGAGFTARGTADTKMGFSLRHALRGALALAKSAIKDPDIVSAFPAYTIPALAALDAITKAQKAGLLGKVRVQLQDPTLRKLTRELAEMDDGKRTAMSGGGVCLCDGREKQTRVGERAPVFGPSSKRGAFGLPAGNPHPFAESIRRQIEDGLEHDPLAAQKLARMHDYQRGLARAARS